MLQSRTPPPLSVLMFYLSRVHRRCDPYAFWRERRKDGSFGPTSAYRSDGQNVADDEVRLSDVAPSIEHYMFEDGTFESASGLLIHLNFSHASTYGVLYGTAGSDVPAVCNADKEHLDQTCDGYVRAPCSAVCECVDQRCQIETG